MSNLKYKIVKWLFVDHNGYIHKNTKLPEELWGVSREEIIKALTQKYIENINLMTDHEIRLEIINQYGGK